MKNKELNEKERLFCVYYSLKQNALEAALKSGYTVMPERTAFKLLKKDSINAYISALTLENKSNRDEIAAGLRRLAFGCINDAVTLAFNEEFDPEMLKELDLFNVSEIKVNRGKGVEIKFFDRIKALEKLTAVIGQSDSESKNEFFTAIEHGAAALSGVNDDE